MIDGLNADELKLLHLALAYAISETDARDHGAPPSAPKFDSKQLCRLRFKLFPNVGVSEIVKEA